MRQRAFAAALMVAGVLGALAVPAAAMAAGPHRSEQEPSVIAEVTLHGSHGFRLNLVATDTTGSLLDAFHGDPGGAIENVLYSHARRPPHDEFGEGKLNVRIGRLGHFQGHFVPTNERAKPLEAGCEGTPTKVQKGYFVGSFDFQGERGYTAVHVDRAAGSVTRYGAASCTTTDEPPWHESARQIKEQKERERREIHLVAGDENADVLFQARQEGATKVPGPESSSFQASITGGRVGAFSVSYLAVVFNLEKDEVADFQVPNLAEPLAEAIVAPPMPFSGSATFHLEGSRTATWTGDLAVEIPGRGEVPLTGSGVDAGLCVGASKCTKTLPKGLQALLESPGYAIVTVALPAPNHHRSAS